MPDPDIKLTAEEQKILNESFDKIRSVLQNKNVNIENVLALVTTDDINKTSDQVKIKFAEKNSSHMNMIAFD